MLWEAAAKDSTPYIGCEEAKGRNAHTSEQKLTGIGQLLDRLLQPLWKDAGPLLKILKAKTGAAFGQALKNIPGFRKELVFEHTLEYLQIADATADSPMFSCKMSRDSMAKFAHGGKNSQVFLDIINSRSQRAENPHPYTWDDVTKDVNTLLPRRLRFNDGTTREMPRLKALDATQNSCKLVEVLQTYVRGKTGGKGRLGRVAVLRRPAAKPKAAETFAGL